MLNPSPALLDLSLDKEEGPQLSLVKTDPLDAFKATWANKKTLGNCLRTL